MSLGVPKLPLSLRKKTKPLLISLFPATHFPLPTPGLSICWFCCPSTIWSGSIPWPWWQRVHPKKGEVPAAEAIPYTALSSARRFLSRSRQLPCHSPGNRARDHQATEVGANGCTWAEGISRKHWHQKFACNRAFGVASPKSAIRAERTNWGGLMKAHLFSY